MEDDPFPWWTRPVHRPTTAEIHLAASPGRNKNGNLDKGPDSKAWIYLQQAKERPFSKEKQQIQGARQMMIDMYNKRKRKEEAEGSY